MVTMMAVALYLQQSTITGLKSDFVEMRELMNDLRHMDHKNHKDDDSVELKMTLDLQKL